MKKEEKNNNNNQKTVILQAYTKHMQNNGPNTLFLGKKNCHVTFAKSENGGIM